MKAVVTKGAALRIALAARALDGVDPRTFAARVGERVAGKLGLPIDEDKLATITLADFTRLLVGNGADEAALEPEQDAGAIEFAWHCLRGETDRDADVPVPESSLDIPASLLVAVASNTAENLDGHFGSAPRFLIYQVGKDDIRLIDVRATTDADASGEKNAARAALIGDCHIVYILSIGGPAAAKVTRAGVYPVKIKKPVAAREAIAKLQTVLDAPPPWLARAMGVQAKSLVRFAAGLEAA